AGCRRSKRRQLQEVPSHQATDTARWRWSAAPDPPGCTWGSRSTRSEPKPPEPPSSLLHLTRVAPVPPPTRVLVVAFDAADRTLATRLAHEGRMPVLRSLLEQGRAVDVDSPYGLFVGAVWPT